MGSQIKLDGVTINEDSDCYVIAEIGSNHMGELETCKAIMRAAKETGANAVKLQKRDNRRLYTKAMYDSPYINRNSFGATYGEHRDFLEFGRAEYLELKRFCAEIGVTFFATAFDVPSADFLAELEMPAYKIASGDLTNLTLLKHVATFGRPIIFSTGGGSMADVQRAYDIVAPVNSQICIMQCTSGYPAEFDQLNLRVIDTFCHAFPDVIVGYSGHDNGIAMPLVAYVLGARVVEKHFTLNRTWKGTDQVFSLTPDGLRKMVRDLKRTRVALGSHDKCSLAIEEQPMLKMRKKLVAARDLAAGHVLAVEDIAMKSPGDGLPPYEIGNLVGQKLHVSVKADTALSHSMIEHNERQAGLVR
jgi:sialic acid synthase SpsE